jgi:hypothetical protein
MYHYNSMAFELGGPGFRITGARKNDLYPFLDNNFDVLLNIGVKQGHINREGLSGSRFATLNMRAQNIGVHASRANNTKASGVAHCAGQLPSAAPDHARLHNGFFNFKKFANPVMLHKNEVKTLKIRDFKFNAAHNSPKRKFLNFLVKRFSFYIFEIVFELMKRLFTILLISVFSLNVDAQWLWDYGFRLGASNYLGDIGGKEKTRRDFVADMKLAKTRWDGGVFVRYKLEPKLSVKLALDWIRIEGDDKLSSNPGRHFRNFNFKNDLINTALTGEFFFFEDPDLGNTYRYRNSFRAYVLGGVCAFYTSPKTLYKGEYVKLKEMDIEGYNYKSFVLGIPTGLGFYFTFDKKHRFGFEMVYYKTFSDYLDDISGNYPDAPPAGVDPALAIRTTELDRNEDIGAFDSHGWGQKRGDKTHKDAFVTMSLSYSYVIRGKSSFYKARRNGFFSRKRKMRKIRAKF